MTNSAGMSPQWAAATEAIRAAQRILIVSHVNPDGDAIGSSLGLANALKQMGKDVTIANDDGVPPFLRWLPGAADIVTEVTSGEFDLMISTDSSDEIRTGNAGEYGRSHSTKVINLDHHPTNTYFGDIFLVVPAAVSATEIVLDWWHHAGMDISHEVAVPLLTGLVTDTNGFRISNTTARTLQVAQILMEQGASLTEVTARTLDSMTYDEFILWKQILPTAELHGQVISAYVRLEDFALAGVADTSTAGIVSFLNRVEEAMISVVFKETEEGIRLSMRAKRGYNVADVATALGGGGHIQAAGATIQGTLEEARARVLEMLQEAAAKGTLEIV